MALDKIYKRKKKKTWTKATVVIVILACVRLSNADPETVDGLYLTKKSVKTAPSGRNFHLSSSAEVVEERAPDKAFPQGHFSLWQHKKAGKLRKAFGRYLTNEENKNRVPLESKGHDKDLLHKLQQKQWRPHWMPMASLLEAQSPSTTTTRSPKSREIFQWDRANERMDKDDETLTTTKQKASSTPITLEPQRSSSLSSLTPSTGTPSLSTTMKSPKTSEKTLSAMEKKGSPPQAQFLTHEAETASAEAASDHRRAIIGLVIGIVFVSAFAAIGVGLVTKWAVQKRRHMPPGHLFPKGFRSSRDDETPPELKLHPSGISPASSNETSGNIQGIFGHGQGLFSGKLVLSTSPTGHYGPQGGSNKRSNSMTKTMMAAHAAALMPSPAEQTTDDLLSPKCDDMDETSEESSDDTVYECPGPAANNGQLVVTNPFFMQQKKANKKSKIHDQHDQQYPRQQPKPKPIRGSQGVIFHHGIKGVN